MSIEVQTTQNVIIDYEPAGLGNRMLAALIDYLFIGLWYLAWFVFFYTTKLNPFYLFGYSDMLIIILYAVIIGPPVFYHLLCEYFNNGQSLGKAIVKIRVIKIDGKPASFGAYLLRWLFRSIDLYTTFFMAIPGLVGLITIIATKNAQRLGDLVAGTTVVDLKVYKKNRQLRAMELDFQDNYNVTYTDVLNILSDSDIQRILSIVEDDGLKNSDLIINRLTDQIKTITGYSYNGSDLAFLKKIVDDYNYLSLQ